ncbi:MAG: efflux RND transporter permease subunit [Bacteroidales bacterium]|nr:efflux RND transporter permease subunit [Bacteroidales bacterium]
MLNRLLDRPVSVTMILLVLVVLGCVGIGRLPVSLIPDVDIPYVTVQVSAADLSARELDDAVVKPLRRSLVQIARLKDIRSEARDGSAVMTLSFEEGRDIDYFYIEVNEKIDRAMGSLPRIDRPKVFKASATDIPAFYINMTLKDAGGGTFLQMSEFARDVIAKRIEQLPEVAMVDLSGGAEREILVVPDPEALARLDLPVEQFGQLVSSANVTLSNLTIRDGEYHYNVRFRSFAASREDIADVWFKVGGRTLQVKDVARVEEREAPRTGLSRSDGSDAVTLAVIKQSEARMAALRKGIAEQLELFAADYPQMAFSVSRDQTELLDYSIRNLLLNILLAILLDIVVIFFFMKDLRSPLLVALTIPVSLVISFFVFYVIGLSINIISLSGLLLGVGMMVDNTIVLTDNITARWQRGEALREAVVKGTKEVRGAMLSSVLTTCAVFIPLIFLNGLAGQLFYDQAMAVTTVLLVSYGVTVLVLPVYYWALYRKLSAFRPNAFLSRLRFGGALRLYDRTVGWHLGHRRIAWALPLCCAALAAVCLWGMRKEKLPPVTYTDAILHIDWNEHIALEQNRARIIALEQAIQRHSGLDPEPPRTTALVGVPQFVLGHSEDQSMSEASLYVRCGSARELAAQQERLSALVRSRWPAAIQAWGSSGNIFEMVFAEREPQLLARLRPAGGEGLTVAGVEGALGAVRAALPGVQIDGIPLKQDVLYVSDPERMALYGVRFADLTNVLRNALNGNRLFEIVQGARSVPVVLGTDAEELSQLLARATVTVTQADGTKTEIPASALMRQTFEQDFKSLVSGDDGNYYPLALDLPAREVPAAMAAIRQAVRPAGFDAAFTGAWFTNREMLRQMLLVLLVALALLFLILASQFESLVQPFIILSEVVIDLAVSLAALWLLGVSINMMSLIGLVVITGIVINDSILKIDTINRLVRAGMEVEAAVHEAGHRRLKAILMTSLTTVLAVAPFLSRGNMGADLQYPMALVVIVGMAAGTLVSLFYVPTVYAALYKRKAR